MTNKLAVAAKPKKKISKLRTKNMRSIIGDSAEDIQQLLESDNADSAQSLIHKKLLQSLVDVIPMAEHSIRKSKGTRGVYQINALTSSIRELLIDMQASKDRGALGENLVEKIIRPAFLDIGMMVVQEYSALVGEAKDLMSPEDFRSFRQTQAQSRARIAEFIQNQYLKAKDETKQFIAS